MPSHVPAYSLFSPIDDRVEGDLIDPVELAEPLIKAPHRILLLQRRLLFGVLKKKNYLFFLFFSILSSLFLLFFSFFCILFSLMNIIITVCSRNSYP